MRVLRKSSLKFTSENGTTWHFCCWRSPHCVTLPLRNLERGYNLRLYIHLPNRSISRHAQLTKDPIEILIFLEERRARWRNSRCAVVTALIAPRSYRETTETIYVQYRNVQRGAKKIVEHKCGLLIIRFFVWRRVKNEWKCDSMNGQAWLSRQRRPTGTAALIFSAADVAG